MSDTSVTDLVEMKRDSRPISMLTAYDAPTARLVDESGVDVVLVGDSVGNVKLGYDTTIPVSLEQSLSHTAAVSRATDDALVVGDMPFGSYGSSVEETVENAARYLKEGGAEAVKLETPVGGEITVDLVDRLTELGIPVMGHTGLTPQRVHATGGYGVEGRGDDAEQLIETAERLEDAGCFSVVLESIPEKVGMEATETVSVPTIGIGAGRYVDGQVLVIDDMLGFGDDTPCFVKEYADLDSIKREAIESYVDDVRRNEFPSSEHVFDPVD
ncbi:MAG: 3-methyl-2-oxobutanoate hydroxymethyltransferase [Halobacteria archaeon]